MAIDSIEMRIQTIYAALRGNLQQRDGDEINRSSVNCMASFVGKGGNNECSYFVSASADPVAFLMIKERNLSDNTSSQNMQFK